MSNQTGMLYRQTILTDDAVRDSYVDLKAWVESEHQKLMLEEADRLKVNVRIADLKHSWVDLDDNDALKALYNSGEFDVTQGRPYPGCRWRLFSEWPYSVDETETETGKQAIYGVEITYQSGKVLVRSVSTERQTVDLFYRMATTLVCRVDPIDGVAAVRLVVAHPDWNESEEPI